jgi:hypothetical protein
MYYYVDSDCVGTVMNKHMLNFDAHRAVKLFVTLAYIARLSFLT